MASMEWQISGEYCEACSCDSVCPCPTSGLAARPTKGFCDAGLVFRVDRGRYGTDTLSTHALMRGAIVQLHRWNVLPEVIESGATPVRQASFIYGGESVAVPIKPRDGVDALYAPRRHVLDRILVDAASIAAKTPALPE